MKRLGWKSTFLNGPDIKQFGEGEDEENKFEEVESRLVFLKTFEIAEVAIDYPSRILTVQGQSIQLDIPPDSKLLYRRRTKASVDRDTLKVTHKRIEHHIGLKKENREWYVCIKEVSEDQPLAYDFINNG